MLPTWPRFFLRLGCFCLAYMYIGADPGFKLRKSIRFFKKVKFKGVGGVVGAIPYKV